MIYLIIEVDLCTMMQDITAYTNKAEFERHLKLCEKCEFHKGDPLNSYRYTTKIIKYDRSKKQLVKNLSIHGGIELTKEVLERFEEELTNN